MSKLLSRRRVGLFILVLWLVSLALPVFTTCRPGYDHVGGWFILLMGWMGVIVVQPAWFANILILIVAIILIAHRRAPVWLGVLTAALAACALYFKDMVDDTGNVPICHYHAGYWLWLGTGALVLIATVTTRNADGG
jgi:hypothetical protein